MAFGAVDSLIGKLRAIFAESGRGAEWQSLLGVGNPASCKSVKNYLSNVQEEQLKARVTPRQAEPILVNDLLVISEYIRALLLHSSTLRAIQIFIYARDQALFKALFFAGDRAADSLQVKYLMFYVSRIILVCCSIMFGQSPSGQVTQMCLPLSGDLIL